MLPAAFVYAGAFTCGLRRLLEGGSFFFEVMDSYRVVSARLKNTSPLCQALVKYPFGVALLLKKTDSFGDTLREILAIAGRGGALSSGDPVIAACYAAFIVKTEPRTAKEFAAISRAIDSWQARPALALHLHVSAQVPLPAVQRSMASILAQVYGHWELFVTSSTENSVVTRYLASLREDSRIRIIDLAPGGADCPENVALACCSGLFFSSIDSGDRLSPVALSCIAEEILAHPEARLIYSDADVLDNGTRRSPFFKPDWNEELFLAQDYLCQLTAHRSDTLKEAGGFRPDLAPCHRYDAALRIARLSDASQIRHIPRILYHYSHTDFCLFRDERKEKGRQAVASYLAEKGVAAQVHTTEKGICHVAYDLPRPLPKVSCIVAMRDKAAMTRNCLRGVLEETDYDNLEVLLVDNGSVEAESRELFKALEKDARVRIIPWDRPFNYSQIQNMAVREAGGDYVALLNNDILFRDANWLKEMLGHAHKKHIGAVGTKLLFENDRLQHAGIIFGPEGIMRHAFRGQPENIAIQKQIAQATRWVGGVTGACLVVSKEKYLEVGGLDEQNLAIAFNDVDFCIRLLQAGYHNLYTPHTHIYHLESVSRGLDAEDTEKVKRMKAEARYLQARHGDFLNKDPQYNPNLNFFGTNCDFLGEDEAP